MATCQTCKSAVGFIVTSERMENETIRNPYGKYEALPLQSLFQIISCVSF